MKTSKNEVLLLFHPMTLSWPPIHLLHGINQYCVMKKRDLFAMQERDLKFNKTVKFSLSVANLRNQAMLYGSQDISFKIP